MDYYYETEGVPFIIIYLISKLVLYTKMYKVWFSKDQEKSRFKCDNYNHSFFNQDEKTLLHHFVKVKYLINL
jgi:hypothetical protein